MRKINLFFLRKILPKTLLGRSFLIVALPVIFLQAASTYIFFDRHWDALSRRLAISLADEVSLLIALKEEKTDNPAALSLGQVKLGIKMDVLPAKEWEMIEDTYAFGYLDDIRRELASRGITPIKLYAEDHFDDVVMYWQSAEGHVYHFTASRKKIYSPTVYIFMLWSLGLSIVLVSIALLFMRNQIRPILRLAKAAEKFGKGHVDWRLKPHGAAEVRLAMEAFNDMQERISRQIQQRTEMLAGISHDLRTPLTRMRLELAVNEDSIAEEWRTEMQRDITEMEQMISSYLAFAKGEDGESLQRVELQDVLQDLVSIAQKQHPQITLTITAATVVLNARVGALKRCIQNVLSNACRYGTKVIVSLTQQDGAIFITIEDDGAGIPEEQFEAVFRPFYRLEQSRNLDTGGIGLGLSIARDIARSHGGDITLGRSSLGGLKVVIQLHC